MSVTAAQAFVNRMYKISEACKLEYLATIGFAPIEPATPAAPVVAAPIAVTGKTDIVPVSANGNPYVFEGYNVRVIDRDGDPWFVLNDACAVLGIGNASDAASRLDEDEKFEVSLADPHGRKQNHTVINESGLYSLILRSEKPNAKRFKKWVTADVLPTIRKTGGYGAPKTATELIALGWKALEAEVEKQKAIADQRGVVIEELTVVAETLTVVNEELAVVIEENAPKVAVYDAISDSNGLFYVNYIAKLVGAKASDFRLWLRDVAKGNFSRRKACLSEDSTVLYDFDAIRYPRPGAQTQSRKLLPRASGRLGRCDQFRRRGVDCDEAGSIRA